MKKSLTGEWRFRATDEEKNWPAVVPGCQFLDLLRTGQIEDPFVGVAEQCVQWVHDKDYVYTRDFCLSDTECAAQRIELVCRRLDTIAEVRLNDRVVGRADNCHRTYIFPLRDAVQVGQNHLSIRFFSPKKYVETHRRHPVPPNANGMDGIVYIRKPQCHFGWDWGPVLIPVGIGGDIYVDIADGPRLMAPVVRTTPTDYGYAIEVRAEGAASIRLRHPDGKIERAEGDSALFRVTDPQLWWTRELSGKESQPLYTVEAVSAHDDAECRSVRVGLCTLQLDRSADEYGTNFRFVLNGVPLFVKGANYIPPDCFVTRCDATRLAALLDAVQFANLNMLRVWGGGYYADDALLDECDRRGILVWQDFMFACQPYPFFDEGFLDNVLAEVTDNVRRIATHPCLALWCGNNEIEAMHLAWVSMTHYVQWTEKFFYHILPQHLAALDPATPYIPGSPMGSAHNKDLDADHVGDTHLWGVWHGLQPPTHYRKRYTRFCSEFGFESLPSFATMQTYARPQDYPLHSAVQRNHQKCAGGNDKMLHYMAGRFRLAKNIEDLIYQSQIVQQACIADATEHWRRHKGRCNGAMYWQLNDCWPTCSWSSVDYGGQYKALHYEARRFNAPLSVSLEGQKDKLTVHIFNDYTVDRTVDIDWCVFDFGPTPPTFARTTHVVPAEGKVAFDLDTAAVDPRRQGVAVRLYHEGQCLMQRTHLLRPEKRLHLPVGDITVQEECVERRHVVRLHSAVYQRLVQVTADGGGNCSDNFFDLLPDQTKVIYCDAPPGTPLHIRSVAGLSKTSAADTLVAKYKVYLSPRNLAAMLYYARPHKK